ARRQPVQLAGLSLSQPQHLPPAALLCALRLGLWLPPVRNRLHAKLAAVRAELLDRRSLVLSPSPGLWPLSLGALLQRRAAGRHPRRRSGGRGARHLLVGRHAARQTAEARAGWSGPLALPGRALAR